MKAAGVNRNKTLTINGEILKNSAIPAQTPNSALSVSDFVNLFNGTPLLFFVNTTCYSIIRPM